MEEKEFNDIYAIPANYTDSGKILGGMLSPRNAFEALILVLLVGFLEFTLIPVSGTIRIVLMTMTLIPLAIITLMGVDGDSLFQFIGHIVQFLKKKRTLSFEAGYQYE